MKCDLGESLSKSSNHVQYHNLQLVMKNRHGFMINRVCVGTGPTAGEKRARAFSMKENVIAFVAERKKNHRKTQSLLAT